ncbi:MAG: hypothetical protein GY898_18265 [Proteobacteria bacterium]|nr:hypothetical protein [Pseudomonadota bacterium]
MKRILALLPLVLLAACLGQETGISNRHIHGVVTLPPVPLWESESTPLDADPLLNNDDFETADGPFTVNYGFHILRGVAATSCGLAGLTDDPPIEHDCDGGPLPGDEGDVDRYRIRAQYRGPIVFKLRYADDEQDGDLDLRIYDPSRTDEPADALYFDGNLTEPVLDEDGNQVLDDEGQGVTQFVSPRFATQVLPGDEFIVEIWSASDDDALEYELVIVANDPRKHNEAFGTEGDLAVFDTGTDEPIIQDALEMTVGAFLSSDIDNLGNPVGGTSCKDWTFDEEAETFWCAFDMHFVNQVTIEANVLLDGMEDGIDNDCDGIADDGQGTEDVDGDGYTTAEGDCNDHDASIGPFRGDIAGDRKDNDCDGWADNGPDDQDNDGDTYCENGGADFDGDGFCRGPVEVGGLATGDCNDADPAINPGLGNEIINNSIDDDCSSGDQTLSTSNRDNDTTGTHEWSDVEEEACGTNPDSSDPWEIPQDLDGDDLCDYFCWGEVGCPEDVDGDGFPTEREIVCGSDPEDADSRPLDSDLDGICNAIEIDCDSELRPVGLEHLWAEFDAEDTTTPNAAGQCEPTLCAAKEKLCDDGIDNDGDGNDDCDDSDCSSTTTCGGGDLPITECFTDVDLDSVHNALERACGSDATDPDSVPIDSDDDGWCSLVEARYGTSDSDVDDTPTDPNGDFRPDNEGWACVGEADCAQDADADGVHNYTELRCGSDPTDAASLPLDFDGDEICDGLDSDADGDGTAKATQGGGTDCHDLDPNIRPHLTDEDGSIVNFTYDVPNGIDDDCDGIIDENRDWRKTDAGEFVPNTDYETVDEDGDGYSLGLRDCNDTDPNVVIGNYETYTTNIVNRDFSTVHLFAGEVASLNNTGEQANKRRVTETVEYDLEKDRVAWLLEDRWEEDNDPPSLVPTNVPVLNAYFAKQPELGKIWFEIEPNDALIAGFASGEGIPWTEGNFQELGEAASGGKTNELTGDIESIAADSWDGDNDAFHVTFPEAGFITVVFDWDAAADYDARFYCYYFDAINPPNYYSMPFPPGLADLSKPEEGVSTVPLPDGADCYFWLVGYSGGTGGWKLELTAEDRD